APATRRRPRPRPPRSTGDGSADDDGPRGGLAGGVDPSPAGARAVEGLVISFDDVRSERSDASVRIQGTGDPFDLWFRVRGARPQLEAEALVSLVLPVAMAQGEDIDLGGLRLDPDFAAGSATWQEAFATWYPD